MSGWMPTLAVAATVGAAVANMPPTKAMAPAAPKYRTRRNKLTSSISILVRRGTRARGTLHRVATPDQNLPLPIAAAGGGRPEAEQHTWTFGGAAPVARIRPGTVLEPRGVGFDGPVARAVDVLDEQQSSLVVGTGGVPAVSGAATRTTALPAPPEAP